MRHLASVAGVTPATVSMALSGHPRISQSTRRLIQDLAKDLGYVPNPYVSALMRIRRQGDPENCRATIGLINLYNQRDGWEQHHSLTIRQMRLGIFERAAKRGYHLEEFWLNEPAMKPSRLSDILAARGIRGIVLSPFPDKVCVPKLKWENFSAVAVTVPQPSVPITTVCNDHYFSMLQALRECHKLGYRRPGLIIGEHLITRFQGRWQAGYWISRDLLDGMMPFEPMYLSEHFRPSSDQSDIGEVPNLDRWIDKFRPDVIITSDAPAIQAHLARLGLRAPADIGLVWTGCPELGYPISGLYQNGQMIGGEALDAVTSMVERNDHGLPEQASAIMVEAIWNPGETLRKVG